jgi:hypothetical protein
MIAKYDQGSFDKGRIPYPRVRSYRPAAPQKFETIWNMTFQEANYLTLGEPIFACLFGAHQLGVSTARKSGFIS